MKNRDRFAKRLVSLIIAALLVCTAGPVFAEGEEAASPFIDSAPSAAAVTGGQVRFIENEPKNEVKNIGFNFMDTKTRAYGCAGGCYRGICSKELTRKTGKNRYTGLPLIYYSSAYESQTETDRIRQQERQDIFTGRGDRKPG